MTAYPEILGLLLKSRRKCQDPRNAGFPENSKLISTG